MPADFLEQVGFGEKKSRRRFLAWVNAAAGGAIAAIIGVPVIAYLLDPILKNPPAVWEDLGAIEDFPVGDTKLLAFEDVGSVPWSGKTSTIGVWVRHATTGATSQDFIVFSGNCTHLGCPVNWLQTARIFECPCHGGVFYANGDVAAGPPPHPLLRHPVRIVDGHVQALAEPLRVSG